GQIGRSARANLGHRHDKAYIGTAALRKSKSLIRLDFLIDDFNAIEPLDEARFQDPRRRFLAEATDCRTGNSVFWERGQCDIFSAVKASASMPFVTPMVDVDGVPCLDGGCSCGIPFDWALGQGFDKIVVIRTRHRSYRKPAKERNTAEAVYRRWPEFARNVDRIPATYNELCDRLEGLEQIGRIFVLAPERPIRVSRVEGDLEKLGALYWQGYTEGLNSLEGLAQYLGMPL
ncbi:MAG: patatin family protein, partial [Candidatus Faecousia sp.]|nr:patatin family protein [Candidatus Faecousia sp.]